MNAMDNVTPLEPRQSNGHVTRARAMLDRCVEFLTEGLGNALPKVMDNVDDALFDLADKSVNNQQQSVYFEAMRELRMKRAGLEATFARSLAQAIDKKLDPRSSRPPALVDLSQAQLGLVDTDEMESSIAVTNMVTKIRTVCHDQLFALERRVAFLLGDPTLEEDRNPLGPEVICNSIREACDETESAIEVRLIVLKLFDRQVAAELGPIYDEINDYLAKRGVLTDPTCRPARQPRPSPSRPASPRAPEPDAAPAGEGDGQPATMSELERLVHVLARGAPAENLEPAAYDLLAQSRVLGRLTRLQQGDHGADDGSGIDTALIASGAGNVVRQLKAARVIEGVGEMDALVTDVVALMFDYIFDDPQIPAPMKALIGRLQIPVLKVAIMDKSLFGKKQHPTKLLLDRLAAAGIGRAEEAEDDRTFYQQIEQIVLRILDEFEDGLTAFESALEALNAFLDEESRRAERHATRASRLTEGRERLAAAKQAVAEMLGARLDELTDPLRDFLDTHWREHLITTFIKEGAESEAFASARTTLDDLLWTVEPKIETEDRQRLVAMLPELGARLKAVMVHNAMPRDECRAFLVELHDAHVRAMQRERRIARPAPAATDGAAEPASVPDPVPPPAPDENADVTLVRDAIEAANGEVHATAQKHAQCQGMGTTVVAARLRDNHITVGHVGDSRLYRLRGGRLAQLTRDHSLRQHLMDEHGFTAEEAESKVSSNIVTRAVGVDATVEPTVARIYALPGDLFLACSDGLTDMLEDARIGELMVAAGSDLDAIARSLVEEANVAGGRDNISVALVHVREAFPEGAALEGRIAMSGLCDVGRKRSHNEDSLGYSVRRGHLTLADGMGGCNAGEVASGTAVNVIMQRLKGEEAPALDCTPGAAAADPLGEPAIQPDGPACEVNFAALNAVFWEGEDAEPAVSPADVADTGSAAEFFDAVFDSLQGDDADHAEAAALHEADRARCLALVDALELGTWIEFRHEDEKTVKARLTWISPSTGRYLFTDRRGLKVADSSREGLALEFQLSYATVVDRVPLFDRAISSVTARLRSSAPEGA